MHEAHALSFIVHPSTETLTVTQARQFGLCALSCTVGLFGFLYAYLALAEHPIVRMACWLLVIWSFVLAVWCSVLAARAWVLDL